jgi:hypothetical protein
LFGGEIGLGLNSNTVYVYDIGKEIWKKPKIGNQSIIPKVDSHCAVVVGSDMYIYGGYVAEKGVLMKDIYALNL